MKVIDLHSNYKVKDASKIFLDIIIGDAQIGSSIVFLDTNELGRGVINNLEVGTGADLKGKRLKIKSIVSDVNDMTNKTSITFQLRGGVNDQPFLSNATVDENGDSIIYRAIFSFE